MTEVDKQLYHCIIDIFLVTASSYKTKYGHSTVQKEEDQNMNTHYVIAA